MLGRKDVYVCKRRRLYKYLCVCVVCDCAHVCWPRAQSAAPPNRVNPCYKLKLEVSCHMTTDPGFATRLLTNTKHHVLTQTVVVRLKLCVKN